LGPDLVFPVKIIDCENNSLLDKFEATKGPEAVAFENFLTEAVAFENFLTEAVAFENFRVWLNNFIRLM
jgi:hypothetical protein